MQYTTIKVCSHPRTGSHYVTALLSTNFFGSNNYLQYYGGHLPWGMESSAKVEVRSNKKIGYVYITRDTDATLHSIFVLRKRFGLVTKDFPTFLQTKYAKMWSPHTEATVTRTTLTTTTKHNNISQFFKGIQFKPTVYLDWHKTQWQFESPNLIIIDYDKILGDLQGTLDEVATWLGIPTKTYKNIEQQVGWKLAH